MFLLVLLEKKKCGVQAYKITLWTETVSHCMVWKIQCSNAEAWI